MCAHLLLNLLNSLENNGKMGGFAEFNNRLSMIARVYLPHNADRGDQGS